ncbi:NADP-dependent oxidoreductase [Silvimonas amylolytica]|uniref:Quinone oxidoreductase n=1 Tax=Silvimonas amylolytica TaxID=449663 RepID=A0ABQ2PRK6_9NEIS|nr:NADP-dependent oxidoreductase [Silvimonas amylolytica]GGP27622.1 quinone oxidoreductase [Silvimonas amylolytica]
MNQVSNTNATPAAAATRPASLSVPLNAHAVVVREFGGIDQLDYTTVPVPTPGMGQVLVRVLAVGVGPWDAWVRSGHSVVPQPLPLTPGSDICGIVVNLGPDVDHLKVGDEVYGVTNPRFTDGYADYAIAHVDMIALKPQKLGYEEAASAPVLAVTAHQMLFNYAELQPGQRVLIHGAAGNVGAYAVQLAHNAGAYVIGTASSANADYVRSLGADEVVIARTGSFASYANNIDVVIDLVGAVTHDASWTVLREGGVLVSAVTEPDKARAAEKNIRSDFLLVSVKTDVLNAIGEQLNADRLHTRVGEVLRLSEAKLAHGMLEGKPHRAGKIVLIP